MSAPIARFFASMSIAIDRKSVMAVDKTLDRLEKKLRNFGKLTNKNLKFKFDLSRFQVDHKKLNAALGNALDQASTKVVFEIRNFSVNQRNMQAAVQRASRGVARNTQMPISAGRQGVQGVTVAPRSVSSHASANYLHAGGATGAFMRYGAGSLPLIGGAYGVGMLNKANQEMVSANISAQSVLGEQAKPLLDRLAERSDYMGISYKDTLPQFTKFMASSMPLMGVDDSQKTFESFMQFGRTRGADKISMNRALTAIGQMSAKGQIMAEELKGQLGDAAGFGELPQLFAEAYQVSTSGGLTGGPARAVLMKAMEKGQVKTADLLPIVSRMMDDLSKGGIEQARNSSSAQQMRAENALVGKGGLLQQFSEGGGESGFARFWKEAATLLKSATPLVAALTGTFEDLTKTLQAPVYLFGELNKTLSAISLATGIAEKNFTNLAMVGGLMMTKWGRVGIMFSTMLIVLEDIAMGVSGQGESLTGDFIKWMEESGAVMGPFEKGLFGVSAAMFSMATAIKAIGLAASATGVASVFGAAGKGGMLTALRPFLIPALVAAGGYAAATYEYTDPVTGETTSFASTVDRKMQASKAVGTSAQDPNSPMYGSPARQESAYALLTDRESPYYGKPDLLESAYREESARKTMAHILENDAKYGMGFPGLEPMPSKMDIQVNVDITAGNVEDFQEKFKDRLTTTIQETLLQYSQTE